ncbi:MAG: OsmC family protein [Saprospiraceae bacterium]
MKIQINRLDDAFHFEAINEDGRTVQVDAATAIGGHNAGLRPMQLLLVAIGTCSLIDILLILKKQRQDVKDVKITVHGDREQNVVPAPFTSIDMQFTFFGELKPEKVEKALRLGVTKYCSVGVMLEKTAKITYSFDIQPFTT